MNEKIYITTIQIAVVASSTDEAHESIIYSMKDLLKERGAILDWRYDSEKGVIAERGEYIPDEYQEGQAFVDGYMQRVKLALREGRKLGAIKIYKDATGEGLRESKDVIDSLCPEYLKKDAFKTDFDNNKDQLKETYRSGFYEGDNGFIHKF